MVMEGERELLTQVAALQATVLAHHNEQMRENERVAQGLRDLVVLGEERERNQQAREGVLHQQLQAVANWQLTHPRDPGAHPDLKDLIVGTAEDVQSLAGRVADIETGQARRAALAKGRTEVWGIQYKGLTIGLGIAGGVTALLKAIGAI